MDDLEASAFGHCSHLSKTVRDHVVNMVSILVSLGDKIPAQPADRFTIYKKHKIPQGVYEEYDGEAVVKALKETYK